MTTLLKRMLAITPDLTEQAKWNFVRADRNARIDDVEKRIINRYRNQKELVDKKLLEKTKDTEEYIARVLLYMEELRNLPETYPDAESVIWPEIPQE